MSASASVDATVSQRAKPCTNDRQQEEPGREPGEPALPVERQAPHEAARRTSASSPGGGREPDDLAGAAVLEPEPEVAGPQRLEHRSGEQRDRQHEDAEQRS